MDWKTALYQYVRYKNESEIQPSKAEQHLPYLSESCVRRQAARVRLLAEWYREREIRTLLSETRLRIARVSVAEADIQADIELTRSFDYELRGVAHTERRIDRERVYLTLAADGWKVRRVEPQVPEKPQGVFSFDPEISFFSETLPEAADPPAAPYMNPVLFRSGAPSSRRIAYDRAKVRQYADRWWNSANPDYIRFAVDCSNYVSQCLHAGGAPMHFTGRRDAGWWYRGRVNGKELWSYSWAVAHSLCRYLSASTSGLRAERVDSPQQLTIGDVISYDWDGNGHFQHSTIVAAVDARGMPLVNAHTTESYHRYWDYRDSYAWTERTAYRFFHIPDEL